MQHRVVGVIGGIGPQATLAFFSAVLERTVASQPSDHVHLLIDCNPKVPNVNASVLGTGQSVAPALCQAAKKLEAAGAEVLVVVCNAAHAYARQIQDAIKIPLLDMVDAAAREASTLLPNGGRVGIMATDGCLASGIYQRALAARGLHPVVPSDADTETLMQTLSGVSVSAQSSHTSARSSLIGLSQRLLDEGADLLIAACTEIPLILQPTDLPVRLLDPVQAIADRCIEAAGARVAPTL